MKFASETCDLPSVREILKKSGFDKPEPPDILHLEVPQIFETYATWYGEGDGFSGRKMANGKIFDPGDHKTIAHQFLPIGTKLKIRSIDTGREIGVIVRDRGTCKPGKGIDLSEAAARKLGVKRIGVAKVIATIIPTKIERGRRPAK